MTEKDIFCLISVLRPYTKTSLFLSNVLVSFRFQGLNSSVPLRSTMQFLSAIVALISLCTHASTKTIEVAVGQHSLQYMPSTIVADIGDNIQFNFYGVHSVVQSAFESPCKPLPLGLFGGDISSCLVCDAAPPSAFVHSVIDTNPIWFHCASE